jgi:hypothetical protein
MSDTRLNFSAPVGFVNARLLSPATCEVNNGPAVDLSPGMGNGPDIAWNNLILGSGNDLRPDGNVVVTGCPKRGVCYLGIAKIVRPINSPMIISFPLIVFCLRAVIG